MNRENDQLRSIERGGRGDIRGRRHRLDHERRSSGTASRPWRHCSREREPSAFDRGKKGDAKTNSAFVIILVLVIDLLSKRYSTSGLILGQWPHASFDSEGGMSEKRLVEA